MIDLFRHTFDHNQASAEEESSDLSPGALALEEAVKQARQEGFNAGCEVGQKRAIAAAEAEAAAQLLGAHNAIHDQLMRLLEQEEARQMASEKDIVELFLGIAERVFPELLESYGETLALEQVRACFSRARTAPILRIEGNAALIEKLKESMQAWAGPGSDVATIALSERPEIADGEARVFWESGRLEYDLGQATAQVLAALHRAAGALQDGSQELEVESA